MAATTRLEDLMRPVVVRQAGETLAQVADNLAPGVWIAVAVRGQWRVLPPQAVGDEPAEACLGELSLPGVKLAAPDTPCEQALTQVAEDRICFLLAEGDRILGVVPVSTLIQYCILELRSCDTMGDLLKAGLDFSKTLVWKLPLAVDGQEVLPRMEEMRCWGPLMDVTGYSLEELRSTPLLWPAALHPQDRQAIMEAVRGSIQALSAVDQTVRVRHRKGHWLWLRQQIEALPEKEGLSLIGVTSDVTHVVDLQRSIAQNQALFRSLTEHALFGVYLIQDGCFRYVNRRLAELFGYQPSELMGRKGPLDLTHPQDRDRIVENLRRRLEGKVDQVRYTFRGLRKDGAIRYVEVLGRRVEIDGRPAILGTLQDITEERLREQEQSLTLAVFQALSRRAPRQGLEGAFEAISRFMALDAAGVLIMNLEGSWQMTQVWVRPSEEESLQRLLQDLDGGRTANRSRIAGHTMHYAPAVLRSRKPLYIPDTAQSDYWGDDLRARHGWLTTFVLPLVFEQSFSALLFLQSRTRDAFCAEHRALLEKMAPTFASAVQAWRFEQELQSEHQRMRELVEELPVGVMLLDDQHRLLQSNEAARQGLAAFGVRVEKNQVGDWGDFPLQRVLTKGSASLPLELVAEGPPRRLFAVHARRLEGRRSSQWLIILREMTAEREAERLATVGEFAAGIAHDFNNVIGTMILHAELLANESGLSERAQERLEIIMSQGRHAAALTQKILDFGRVSVSRRVPTSMSKLLDDLQRLLVRVLPESIELEVVKGDDACVVDADPDRLQQALMNLALNARDAMPQGGFLRLILDRVRCNGQARQPIPDLPPGEWIRLQVADTGCGIAPQVLPHVFEPFFTTKERGKGSGLGLAQTYGIVKQHEGFVHVDSEQGKGATFTLYFPPSPFEEGGGLDLEEDGTLPMGRGEKVLVVEDLEIHRRSIAEMLGCLNYQALEAENGEQALEVLAREDGSVDLVLSDVVMPGMDGRRLTLALTKRFPQLPVILMSGYAQGTGTLIERQNVHWLQKPLSKEKLAIALRRALR